MPKGESTGAPPLPQRTALYERAELRTLQVLTQPDSRERAAPRQRAEVSAIAIIATGEHFRKTDRLASDSRALLTGGEARRPSRSER
jgi:hypothetical protein